MKQLKQIIKSQSTKSAFDIIYWGNPTMNTYQQAILSFQSTSKSQKQNIINRALRKLQKQKQPKTCLCILYLLDRIIHGGYYLNLQPIHPKISAQHLKPTQQINQTLFCNLYFQYIKIQTKKQITISNTNQLQQISMENMIKYCECAVMGINKILHNYLIVEYFMNMKNSNVRDVRQQVRYVLEIRKIIFISMIQRIVKDLAVLKYFVKANWAKILNKDQISYRVNQIYQKTVYFSKKADRLTKLCHKYGANHSLQFYKFDKNINKQIQFSMLGRNKQKKLFHSLQLINIQQQHKEIHLQECPEGYSQQSILIYYK